MATLRRTLARHFTGLWRDPDFMKLWSSLTITAFGAQITNLALPLTAAVMLHATPMQMGILVALETLPFALVSLHAGVLIDRVRKLPIVIAANWGRGLALLAIPAAAFTGVLSIELLFVVGFVCGVQNVVGGAAYQVLLAQMAGRERLVEANAKSSLGEMSSALVGPGLAGGLIQLLTAPFAILLDACTFFASALMLRRIRAPQDVAHAGPRASVMAEIHEGLKLVWHNRTLLALAWLAGLWQILHHMQMAVLILFATRDLGLSPGAIGLTYAFGGVGCVLAAVLAERLTARFGVGPVIVQGLILTALGWQAFGLVSGPPAVAMVALGLAMLVFDFGGGALRHQLPVAAPGDHARPAARPDDGDDALPDGGRGAAGVARGRRAGHGHRAARDAADDRRSGAGARGGGGAVVAGAAAPQAAGGGERLMPAASCHVVRRGPCDGGLRQRRDSAPSPAAPALPGSRPG